MKIVITGGDGFLAYHLKEYYKEKYEIISLGRDYIDNLHLIDGCDFLIHSAGVNRHPNPDKIFYENILITKNLINKLNDLNLKINIKFISSVQENLDNPYGKSKLESKKMLVKYCKESKTKFESYSLPNLYGTHGLPNYNSFINTFTYNIINELPTNVNDQSMDLCWVYDAIKVIDNKHTTYNISKTNVNYVYESLLSIHNKIKIENNEFNNNLLLIYNYFKNLKMKILVLGHTGMLGHMVVKYFKKVGFDVIVTNDRFPSESFNNFILNFDGNFIINCIGSIPQRTNNYKVNTDLPLWLSNNSKCKVVHPGTDCEMDNDEYGISKKISSDYIGLYSKNTKILKTSIIGPENGTDYGLLEWFLSQDGKVFGYTNAIWNGNTTLEWAKQSHTLIMNWYIYDTITTLEGLPISKFDMLTLFNKIYNKDIIITPKNLGLDKTLKGNIKTKSLNEQLIELISFTKNYEE